jgi:SNF2 family DNA or RNA helicase
MSKFQKELYRSFLKAVENFDAKRNILYFASILQKVVNHPDLILTFIKNKKLKPPKKIMNTLSEEIYVDTDNFDWAKSITAEDYVTGVIENSSKIVILMDIIKLCLRLNEKCLIFSQFTQTLDIIEKLLENKKFDDKILEKKNYDYVRFDGTTPYEKRTKYIDKFQKNPNTRVFLISTKGFKLI